MLVSGETGHKGAMSHTPPKPPAGGGWVPSDDAGRGAAQGGKLHAPAAERNTAPILSVLAEVIAAADPKPARALELASGSGQHAIAFAEAFPAITWLPSDRDPAGLASIAAWRAEAGHDNLAEPVHVDLDAPDWDEGLAGPFDLIVACNVLHISPFAVTRNLLGGAARLLGEAGTLFVYGCFSRSGDFVSQSNRDFDQSLRRRDRRWGLRDTDEVSEAAARHGLAIARVIEMPANNTAVVLQPR